MLTAPVASGLRLLLVAPFLFAAAVAHAGDGAKASCPATSVAADRVAAMARGFNLVGWLDRSNARRPSTALLGSLRRLGFSHVRLPVDGELLTLDLNTASAVEARLAELDNALGTLLALGYAVSVDMHPSASFNELHVASPETGHARLEAVWRAVAERLRSQPPGRVFVELLNEPAIDPDTWWMQAERLAGVIREILPDHTLIVGAAGFERIEPLVERRPLSDPNIVYAVHYYDPMVFTHQGADWMDDGVMKYLSAVPFPGALDAAPLAAAIRRLQQEGHTAAADALKSAFAEPWRPERISRALEAAGEWGRLHRRAIIVNEFGVLGWKAEPEARRRWVSTVRSASERACMGWAYWELDGGFGFVSEQRDVPDVDLGLVGALLGPPRR